MDVDASCILVLLQCRDREWNGDNEGNEAWAWEAAQRCIDQYFGVLRVPTQNWADVKRHHPSSLRAASKTNALTFAEACPLLRITYLKSCMFL